MKYYVLAETYQAKFELGLFRTDKHGYNQEYYDWEQKCWDSYHTDEKPEGLMRCTEEYSSAIIESLKDFF